MKYKYTKLEKQLIMLSSMGITINIEDGHRWIMFDENNDFYCDTHDLLDKNISTKVYGGVKEAILRIDNFFIKNNMPTLEERFEKLDPEYDIEYVDENEVKK